jgi:hypothetical protein
MIRNFVLETTNAPGTTSTINLAGAVTGRRSFAQEFTSGTAVYYFMDDGTQAEAGFGTFTAGSPNTLTRSTVVWDSVNGSGTPSKRNFTGSTRVYNEVPASATVYLNQLGRLGLGTTNPLWDLHLVRTGAADTWLAIDAPNGRNRVLAFATSGSLRWVSYVSGTAETGANAGSDYAIQRYNDAGVAIDAPVTITRSTGNITLNHNLLVSAGGATINGGLTANGGLTLASGAFTISSGGANVYGYATFNGGVHVYNGLTVDQSLVVSSSGAVIHGSASIYDGFHVYSGGTQLDGGLTVYNGLHVVSGGSQFDGGVTVYNSINIASGGLTISASLTMSSGTFTSAGNIICTSGGIYSQTGSLGANVYNSTTPLAARVTGFGYNGATLQVYTNSTGVPVQFGIENGSGGGDIVEFFWAGSLKGSISTNGATITVNGTSDEDLKNILGPITDSGEILDGLQPIQHEFKDLPGVVHYGFGAQTTHKVFPIAVTPGRGKPGDPDFRPWLMNEAPMISVLVAEVQELRKRVALLENRQ